MSQLVIEEDLLMILSRAEGPTEIRDAEGRLVGIFTPTHASDSDFDLESADRVLLEEGHLAITTSELISDLRRAGR